MTLFQAFILGCVQGLTEFLPVSSSGHLVLFQHLFKFDHPPITFDILVHLATLLAVIIFFRQDLKKLLHQISQTVLRGKFKQAPPLFYFLIIGTIPATIFGFLIRDSIEIAFASLTLVGIGFLISAAFLFSAQFLSKPKVGKTMKWQDSLFIGLTQALAIIPGISRSGSTISTGLLRGLSRQEAFTFSFLLAIPAIIGAVSLDLQNLFYQTTNGNPANYLVGFLAAFGTGLIALKLLKKIVLQMKLGYFGVYCLILGILTIYFSL